MYVMYVVYVMYVYKISYLCNVCNVSNARIVCKGSWKGIFGDLGGCTLTNCGRLCASILDLIISPYIYVTSRK